MLQSAEEVDGDMRRREVGIWWRIETWCFCHDGVELKAELRRKIRRCCNWFRPVGAWRKLRFWRSKDQELLSSSSDTMKRNGIG
ncbi:hypothetical protein RchiOBHm_Chr7g0183641 [Rosa chinensis]|uniref:Uncharacterized protein n=1 Tax=Rosa chinensis TaxID=74649 RepID=A0A2P6P3A6_ROSCH|nr:hypothetical protein RchiOBHm_Chr7g0183641 [Rosa chinensis]